MKKISVQLTTIDELFDINKIIGKSKFDGLNIDAGLNESYMVDGRSIIGLISTFGQNMLFIIYGEDTLEEAFIEEIVSKGLNVISVTNEDKLNDE